MGRKPSDREDSSRGFAEEEKEKGMFTKKETNICKGIAIILMLFHHLFNDFEEYAGYEVSYWPFTSDRIYFWALLSKICVAVFVFLSGYGIASTFRRQFGERIPEGREISLFIWKRYWKLMAAYWFVFILTLLCQPLGRTIFDAYGSDVKEILLYFVIDFFGVSYLLETPTLNPTWWYMSIALVVMLLVPAVVCLMRRYGAVPMFFLGTISIFFMKTLNSSTFYLFGMMLGVLCCEVNFFDRLQRAVGKNMQTSILTGAVEVICFAVLLSYRTNYSMWGIVDGLLALDLACMAQTFLGKIPVISKVLQSLGKHSGNMFLTHNQIYSFYFLGFFYSFRNWGVIVAVLTAVTYVLSIGLEWLKEKLYYNRMMDKMAALKL